MDSGDAVAALYEKLAAPLIRTDLETAEMVKYVDNSWHALKIGFANEIGILAKSLGVDAHAVQPQAWHLHGSEEGPSPGFAPLWFWLSMVSPRKLLYDR